jgi:ribonuclease D
MEYQYIDTNEQLAAFGKANENIKWLAFDTEFVGEKRYTPLLCLIQAVTEHDVYVIDPLAVTDFTPFLQIVENEAIVKITHAGENDYRVLHSLFGTMPKNLFDTQVAASFLHGVYPMSFQKLAEKELQVRINKTFTVTDWEIRPISPKQLKYAFDDVVYLPKLWQRMTEQLNALGRWHWVKEELAKIETPQYYEADPLKEVLQNNLATHLSQRQQLFLIRVLAWRRQEAERKNYSKEMILPLKTLTMVVKSMSEGKDALKQNRMISDKTLARHWNTFNDLYQAKMTEEERQMLERLPKYEEETPEEILSAEFLYLLIRHKCMKANVAHSLVMSKTQLKANSDDLDFLNNKLNRGWRKELLGENLIQWICEQSLVDFEVAERECVVRKVDVAASSI